MEVDVVDADGKTVPISRLMLHHIVFYKLFCSMHPVEMTDTVKVTKK